MILWSTPESIERGEASWLAVLETILAVAAYWGIAWYFDTHTHLLISVLIAPMLLLRSPESTELGVKWFKNYWSGSILRLERVDRAQVLLLAITAFSYTLFFGGDAHTGSLIQYFAKVISGLFIFSMIFYIIIITIATFISGKFVSYFSSSRNTIASILLIPSTISTAIWLIYFYLNKINFKFYEKNSIDIVKYTASLDLFEFCFIIFISACSFLLLFLFLSLGPMILGAWLRSITIRFVATLLYYRQGICCMAENLRRALLVIDSRSPTELVPGMSAHDDGMTVTQMVRSIRANGYYNRISRFFAGLIWFTVALFYRWSLKSTCWLYLPLVYLAWPRKASAEDDKLWLRLLYQGRMETVRRVTALLVGVSIALYTFPLLHLAGVHVDMPQAPALAYLLAFDLKKLAELAPWQWCSLLTAAITAAVWLISERLQYRLELTNCWQDRAARWLLHLVRTRTVVTAVSMLLALGFVVLGFPKFYPDSFPGWMNVDLTTLPHWLGFIGWVYGPYLPNGGAVG